MNLLDRALLTVDPQRALRRAQARIIADRLYTLRAKAGYDGAGNGRRSFTGQGTSQNTENRRSAKHLRYAARELERNNPYVGVACDRIDGLVIGKGIRPVARYLGGKSKKAHAKKARANALMRDWLDSTDCDYYGNHNLAGVMGLSMRTVALSGESLIGAHFEKDRRLAVPLRLQLMEGDLLDDSKNMHQDRQNAQVQGIEIKNGRRTRYHLFDSHPGESSYGGTASRPVDAHLIAHAYEILRPGQMRGIPRGYSVFSRMKGLDDFNDAFIELQRMAACFGGFVYEEDAPMAGSESAGDPLPEAMEPGIMLRLKAGERVGFSTPPTLSGQSEFIDHQELLIAAAYGLAHSTLTGNFKGQNFSSAKMARIIEGVNVHRWQHRMIIPMQYKRIEQWFLLAAERKGYDVDGLYFDWTPQRKEILNLKDELPAIIRKVRAGLGSLQGELRELGYDIDTVLEEIADDNALIDQFKLILDSDGRNVNQSGQYQRSDTGNPAEENSNDD